MNFTEQQIISTLTAFIWPFIRLSSMFISIPVFSIKSLPARVRVMAAFFITLTVVPVLPAHDEIEIFSYPGFLVTVQQLLIGLATGFILQMVFAVMVVAGQSIAFSMGLGFSSMVDPATGVQVPVVAEVFVVTSSLVFLGVNGHLLLIEMLVQSFHTLPIGIIGLEAEDLWSVIIWSGQMFATGVLLALPIMAALLFVNISFGVAARAAPQLQIFGVGFPITIMMGMVLIWVALPNMLEVFADTLHEGYKLISKVLKL